MALMFLFAFALISPQGYVNRIESIFNLSLDPNGSAAARRDQLIRSFTVTLANPAFGVGMGDFSMVGFHDHETHNAYTQVAAEMGIPALCLYTGFILAAFRRLKHIQREIPPVGNAGRLHYLAFGLQISLVGYMVSSFFVSVAYYWYVYYLVAYAVCLHRICSTLPGAVSQRSADKAALFSLSRARNRWGRTAGARAG
jgi:O-antigen ligase